MKRVGVWSICLLLVLIAGCIGYAMSEDAAYDQLCSTASMTEEHVAAWIEIESFDFCQPIMQHPQDDGYYATHNAQGNEDRFGALYTQAAYNSRDFSDPVTIVYGSSQAEGAPLRDLQELYSGRFDEGQVILLHLPDGTKQYEVFAAVPYSALHILHYYDFKLERRFESFFNGVYSTRQLGMHLTEENRPEFGENVLILSTGLRGDNMQRYLVMAKSVSTEISQEAN